MDKPITVRREEYINAVVRLSNESALPAFVKLEVLEKCCEQLRGLAKQEYAKDLVTWQSTQHEEGDGE